MKTALLRGPGRFEIIETSKPSYGPGEVLIKVLTCGVCSSEIGAWSAGTDKKKVYGHEIVGRIEEVGVQVTGFRPGDRVTGMIYGGFSEYTTASADMLVKVPTGLSSLEAIGEPLSCIQSGVDRLNLSFKGQAVVIGCGYMGLLLIKLLRLTGVEEIIAIDPRTEAREHAMSAGADMAISEKEIPEQWVIRDWSEFSFDRGVAIVCEVTGTQAGLTLAGNMTGLHGQLSVVGYHVNGLRTIDLGLWGSKALTIYNSHERRDDRHVEMQKRLLESLNKGLWECNSLYTNLYTLDMINQAFEDLADKPEGFIKAALIIDKDEQEILSAQTIRGK